MLSPHIFLLAILFRHQAFLAPELNEDPSLLERMQLRAAQKERKIELREDLGDVFIFRKTKKTVSVYAMGQEKLTRGIMTPWIRVIGLLAGFEYPTIAYSLRYMAGNTLDQNGKFTTQGMIIPHRLTRHRICQYFSSRFGYALWVWFKHILPALS